MIDRETIARIVCQECGVEWKYILLRTKRRKKVSSVVARQLYFYMARVYGKRTLKDIASDLGKHYSSVIWAIKRIVCRLEENDKTLMPLYHAIKKRLDEIPMPRIEEGL